MGGAVFPLCCLAWGQTVVEVMKIMVTSFKRSSASTAALSVPDRIAGHCWPTPLPETPGHPWANLGQFLVGSLLLSPASGAHKVLFVPSKSPFPRSCVSSGSSMVGLMMTSSKKAMPDSGLLHPESMPLQQAMADPYLCRRHSDTQQQVWLSLCVLSWCTQGFVWALRASLATMEFNCKCSFAPSSILVGLLLYPWTWDIFCVCVCGIQHFLLMAAQQQVIILELLQEKMSTCPTTPPSWPHHKLKWLSSSNNTMKIYQRV